MMKGFVPGDINVPLKQTHTHTGIKAHTHTHTIKISHSPQGRLFIYTLHPSYYTSSLLSITH